MKISRTRDYVLTFLAMLFVALVVSRQSLSFSPTEESRECKVHKGIMNCDIKITPKPLVNSTFEYVF